MRVGPHSSTLTGPSAPRCVQLPAGLLLDTQSLPSALLSGSELGGVGASEAATTAGFHVPQETNSPGVFLKVEVRALDRRSDPD